MTALLPQEPAQRPSLPMILRRGVLSERQRRILVAVWRAWGDYRSLSIRELQRACGHASTSTTQYQVARLAALGWLSRRQQRYTTRTTVPGPRFAACERQGSERYPLEIAGAWVEAERLDRRAPKWDRKAILFGDCRRVSVADGRLFSCGP